MVCDKCLPALNKMLVGQKTDNGYIAKEVRQHSKKALYFNGYKPQFLIYIQAEKTQKNSKVVEKEIDQLFNSKFCPSCGDKLKKEG